MGEPYRNSEMTDMILIYGEVRNNSAAAVCIYTECFLARRHPTSKTFVAVERCLRETGHFEPVMNHAGRPRSRRTAAAEENFLRSIDSSPGSSIWQLVAHYHMSQKPVWRIVAYMRHYSTHTIYNLCKNCKERLILNVRMVIS
ncbi:hypothetical protein ANN_19551 [Periplaneta americana]|uniref:DUF4817 domain-containing protein n=1 Tax=Periplaneta americana TaxID=6978 RepID=A0ABQ8SAL3_PERAM|nr:hypothetical protein ANN_19551 [Periplaneta americana]